MNIESKITKLLALVGEYYPNFKPTAQTASIWQGKLGRYSWEQLDRALDYACEWSPDFAPPLPAIRAAIEGRLVRLPVLATDNQGAVIHPPKIVDYAEVRVLPGGQSAAHLVEGEPLPRGMQAVESPIPTPATPAVTEGAQSVLDRLRRADVKVWLRKDGALQLLRGPNCRLSDDQIRTIAKPVAEGIKAILRRDPEA